MSTAESKKTHYEANKATYLARNAQKRRDMKLHIAKAKDVPCVDCGNRYPPYVMDFDHRNPATKSDDIATIINKLSWNKLYEEIAKCDVVCSNCHRIRTAKQFGWNEYGFVE